MRKLLKWAAVGFGALVLIGIGAALGSGGADNSDRQTATRQNDRGDQAAANAVKDDDGDGVLNPYDPEPDNPDVSSYEEEETPEPAAEPDPNGDYKLNCDYVLGDFGESGDPNLGYRFIGGGNIRNTGNVGIVARATFTWELLGADPIREVEEVRLRVGQRRRLRISVPATDDQIDLHQSADGECRTRVKILDTFGAVQE